MNFVSAEIFEAQIPFRLGFKHALADRKYGHVIFVRLKTESGQHGWGEVVPRDYLTGESIESVWKDICDLWWPAVREMNFELNSSSVRDTLSQVYIEADSKRKTASYAGIDLAVYDAAARCAGQSLHSFMEFTGVGGSFLLTAPLGGSSCGSVSNKAMLFRLLGFKDYKIKLALGRDLDIVRTARKYIGCHNDLRADANAGWSVDEALDVLSQITEYGLSSIEQPVADVEGMAQIRAKLGMRVMADESLCTLADARELIEFRAADLWNIRLAKIGGFSGLLSMLELAAQNDISLHLGSLVGETSLLQAAGRIAAAAAPFEHVEYSFPRIFLKPDPFRGGPAGYFGKGLLQAHGAGLGVYAHAKSLGKVCVRKITLD